MSTTLKLTNNTGTPVDVYIWLADTSQVLISDLPFVTNADGDRKGWFSLNGSVEYTGPDDTILQGNLAVNSYANNCPDRTNFPNGINLFEFNLNMPYNKYASETVDISCVAGCNSHMKFSVPGDEWKVNYGTVVAHGGENLPLNQNTGQTGVFPYGCTDCVARVTPPDCPDAPPYTCDPQAERICQLMRQSGNSRGTVEFEYKGLY